MFEIYFNVVCFGLDHGLVQISEGGKIKILSQWHIWWGMIFLWKMQEENLMVMFTDGTYFELIELLV